MDDEKPVRIAGYALTYENIDRPELERAVARCGGVVPLRVGSRIVGDARVSVDATGFLRVEATLEPLSFVVDGYDDGIPYGHHVHDTRAPEALRLGQADLSATLRPVVEIQDVSIHAIPAEETQ